MVLNDPVHDGFVERVRRGTSGTEDDEDEIDESEPLYTLYSKTGSPCILAKTDAIFYLEYRTKRHGVQVARVDLPKEPEVSGSCVNEGDTAVLTMKWSVFRFSLRFTENPEGNSYYLDTAVLEYNQTLDIFYDTTYRGSVYLSTGRNWNYYFTPLGRSYVCRNAEDQGPLDLYNDDDEKAGNMSLYNTKFQPFVKRAKGDWGPELHCLPKHIKIMRENVVPYAVSLIFVAGTSLTVAGYALFRHFHVQKSADYSHYTEGQPLQAAANHVEAHEMTSVDQHEDYAGYSRQAPKPEATAGDTADLAPQASNPFRKEPNITNNPFKQ